MAYTTIDDPSAYFQIATYTGNVTNRTITNDGNSDLQPDLIWFKNRDTTNDNEVFDSSRGKTRRLIPNSTAADDDSDTRVRDFNTDGFDCGTDPSANGDGNEMVAWQWKANGGTTSSFTESGNNPGGTIQTNTTAGFSIITYTGTGATGTISHGLGVVPELIMCKQRSNAESWGVYHGSNTAAPETDYLLLDTTAATADNSNRWGDTAPTSSVFTVDTANEVNTDARTYVAYVFTSIQGYSKFGSYIANNSTDGPFVYLGFKPAWIMVRNTSTAADWPITDNKREVGNPFGEEMLFANGSDAETSYSGGGIDFVSNGFKIRSSGTNGVHNANNTSHTFIYMAFAESPFVSSEGVPTTAK